MIESYVLKLRLKRFKSLYFLKKMFGIYIKFDSTTENVSS